MATDYADAETFTASTFTAPKPKWCWHMGKTEGEFGQLYYMMYCTVPPGCERPNWLVRFFQRVLLGITWERIEDG